MEIAAVSGTVRVTVIPKPAWISAPAFSWDYGPPWQTCARGRVKPFSSRLRNHRRAGWVGECYGVAIHSYLKKQQYALKFGSDGQRMGREILRPQAAGTLLRCGKVFQRTLISTFMPMNHLRSHE
jgi:hypothetical protein